MARLASLLSIGVFLLPLSIATAQDTAPLDTPEQRYSYAIGQNVGNQLKNDLGSSAFDPEAFSQAIKDVFGGTDPRLTRDEMGAAFDVLRAQQESAAAAVAEAATAEGRAFLAEQKGKDGIIATESGLLYQITKEGDGPKPAAADTVVVHYTGRLLDGTVFDSSVERGQPAEFPVNRVIAGWTEALQLMGAGSTWEVWIPSDLAYGAQGAGGDIPPHAVLNFTIELIAIKGQ